VLAHIEVVTSHITPVTAHIEAVIAHTMPVTALVEVVILHIVAVVTNLIAVTAHIASVTTHEHPFELCTMPRQNGAAVFKNFQVRSEILCVSLVGLLIFRIFHDASLLFFNFFMRHCGRILNLDS